MLLPRPLASAKDCTPQKSQLQLNDNSFLCLVQVTFIVSKGQTANKKPSLKIKELPKLVLPTRPRKTSRGNKHAVLSSKTFPLRKCHDETEYIYLTTSQLNWGFSTNHDNFSQSKQQGRANDFMHATWQDYFEKQMLYVYTFFRFAGRLLRFWTKTRGKK